MAVLSAGCGKIPKAEDWSWVHRIDIQQGNVVTEEMLDKLKPGMEKRKVRFILGTPLIVSAFNKDRWDYVYSFQSGREEREEREQRRISLFFEGDRLHHIEGNVTSQEPAPSSGTLKLKSDRRLPTEQR